MPRVSAKTADAIVDASMRHFWQYGFNATSMDEMVAAIGVSRHAIYTGIGSKHELYRRGFSVYQREIVTPALARVEQPDAGLDAIGFFLEIQIAAAEKLGLPGPGCLVANAATETAPHDKQISIEVAAHHLRLKQGFAGALTNEQSSLGRDEIEVLADFLVTTTQGLWSMSRTVSSAAPLRAHVATLMSLLKARLRS
jgi:TetR/AcrR family transcriptional regulator, transcriptional repressor for nem operon